MPKRGKARSKVPGGQQKLPAVPSHAPGALVRLLASDSRPDRWQRADYVANVCSLLSNIAQDYEAFVEEIQELGLPEEALTDRVAEAAARVGRLLPLLAAAQHQVADLLQQQHKLQQEQESPQPQQQQKQQQQQQQAVQVPGRLLVGLLRCQQSLGSLFCVFLDQDQVAHPTAAATVLAGARLSVTVLLSYSSVAWDSQQQRAEVLQGVFLSGQVLAGMALLGKVPSSGDASSGSSASNGSSGSGSINLLLEPAAVQFFVLLLLIDAQACSTRQHQRQLQQGASSSSSSSSSSPKSEPLCSSPMIAMIKEEELMLPVLRDTLLALYTPLELSQLVARVANKMQLSTACLQQLAEDFESEGHTGQLLNLVCACLPRTADAALVPVGVAEPEHQQQPAKPQHSHNLERQQLQQQRHPQQQQKQEGQQQEQQEYRVVEPLQQLLGSLAWDLPALLLALGAECGRSCDQLGLSTNAATGALYLLKVWRWCSKPMYEQMLQLQAATEHQRVGSTLQEESCQVEAAIGHCSGFTACMFLIDMFVSVLHHWECLARAELARFAALSSSSSSSSSACSGGSSGAHSSSSSSSDVDKQLRCTIQALEMLAELLPVVFQCGQAVSHGRMHPVHYSICNYSSAVTSVLEQLVRQVLSARSGGSSNGGSSSRSSSGSSAAATDPVHLAALSALRSLDNPFSELLQLEEEGECGWVLAGAGGTLPCAAARQQQVFGLAVSLLKLLGSNHMSIHGTLSTHISLGNLGPSNARMLAPVLKEHGCSLAAIRAALAPWLVLWGRYLLTAAVLLQQTLAFADQVFTTGVLPGPEGGSDSRGCTGSSGSGSSGSSGRDSSDSKGRKGSSGSSSGNSLEERLKVLARTPLQFVAGTVAQTVLTGAQTITRGEDSVRSCYSSCTAGQFTGTNTFPVPGSGQQEPLGAAAAGAAAAPHLFPNFHLQHPGLPVELLQFAAGSTATAGNTATAAAGSSNGSSSSSMLSCVLLDDLDGFSDAHLQPLQQLCQEVVLLCSNCVEVYTCPCCDESKTAINHEGLTALLHSPALRQLPAVLHAAGTALCSQLPVPWQCNNPGCTNMARDSELLLVGGKGCVCARCKVARYCGRACQVAHWKLHKPVCKRLAAQAAAGAAAAAPAGPAEAAA